MRPSRGCRVSMATIRKKWRCLRPSIFMRILTDTIIPSFLGNLWSAAYVAALDFSPNPKRRRTPHSKICKLQFHVLSSLPAFLLAFLVAFLGGPAVPCARLFFGQHGAGLEHAALVQAADH